MNEQIGGQCYANVCVESPQRPNFDITATLDGYCVSFIKKNGYGHLNGNAIEWVKYINSEFPEVGGVVVLDESFYGHLALITEVSINDIKVIEQNYQGRWIVSSRVISRDYDKILGFIKL